jgi:hypothetical protein
MCSTWLTAWYFGGSLTPLSVRACSAAVCARRSTSDRARVARSTAAHQDSDSEAAIQLALKIPLAGRTSLVIVHRLSTIQEADQILVIDDDQIRERGTHDGLLADGGLYADLYRTQFKPNGRTRCLPAGLRARDT